MSACSPTDFIFCPALLLCKLSEAMGVTNKPLRYSVPYARELIIPVLKTPAASCPHWIFLVLLVGLVVTATLVIGGADELGRLAPEQVIKILKSRNESIDNLIRIPESRYDSVNAEISLPTVAAPRNWVQLARTLRLDGANLTASSDALSTPCVHDIVLTGDCLWVITPSYRSTTHWDVWGGETPLSALLGLQLRIAGLTDLPLNGEHVASSNDVHSLVIKWCSPNLAPLNEVRVSMRLLSMKPVNNIVVTREPGVRSPQRAHYAAACAMFQDPVRFLTWTRYMHTLGFFAVFGYFNGPAADLLASPAALEIQRLAEDGSVVMFEWNFPVIYSDARPLHAQSSAMNACQARAAHFSWQAFLDDDEFIVAGKNDLMAILKSAEGRDEPCVRMRTRWAAAKTPCDAVVQPLAGSCWTDLSGLDLKGLSKAEVWNAALPCYEHREKFIRLSRAAPIFLIHGAEDCRLPENDERLSALHFFRDGKEAHISQTASNLERDFPRATWVQTDKIRRMLE